VDFGAAFSLVLSMAICAAIGFAGGHMILSALFARKITGREAFLLASGLLVLLFLCVSMALRGGPGVILLLLAVAGAALAFRLLALAADRRLTKGIVEEEIAKYQHAMEVDPSNTAAHSLLADTYRRIGQLEPAIEEYQAALSLDSSLRQERYWLERLRREVESGGQKELLCPRCGTPRPQGAGECQECGRMYSAWEVRRHAFGLMPPGRRAAVAGVAVGAMSVLLAIIVLAPGAMKLMGLMVVLLVPAAVFILTARAGGGQG